MTCQMLGHIYYRNVKSLRKCMKVRTWYRIAIYGDFFFIRCDLVRYFLNYQTDCQINLKDLPNKFEIYWKSLAVQHLSPSLDIYYHISKYCMFFVLIIFIDCNLFKKRLTENPCQIHTYNHPYIPCNSIIL